MYKFLTFRDFLTSSSLNKNNFAQEDNYSAISPHTPLIILRHDIDFLPQNALRMAQLEHELGIRGTYFFRIIPKVFDEKIIREIAGLGHEIGYHYETMDSCNGDIDKAYEEFCRNLEKFRQLYPVQTICMHGSPRSKYDNKMIWSKYHYKDLGIIGEPYFDIDFNEFAYFTDTGRRWNGDKVSIRDKVNSKYNFNFKTTRQIIDNVDKLPDKIMFTIHPQRWHDRPWPWLKELVWQNVKNGVKYLLKR